MMRKDKQLSQGAKGKYRIKNWPAYNAGLIARGDVTIWIDQCMTGQAPSAGPAKRGRPCLYTDGAIQMLLGPKQVFRLPLRALQGFAGSLGKLAYPALRVPNYTTLCRRAQALKVVLPVLRGGEPLHLVVDSTGLKVFGEGEWKVRKHGYSKRRTWRKVHLAMDAKTGQICAALMTHQDVGDAEELPDLLDQIPVGTPIAARDAEPSIPPGEGATPWPARTIGAQATEVAIRVGVLDRMAALARPLAVRPHRLIQ